MAAVGGHPDWLGADWPVVPAGEAVAAVKVPSTRPYGLVRPCPKCPFRSDVEPYLRPGRAQEIAESIQSGGEFHCHETTICDPDDDSQMATGPKSKVCAGSLILMEKAGTPNQMMRVAERIGLYDPTALDLSAPVPGSWIEWQRRFLDDADLEREPCSVVGPDCDAPAGYAIGGGVIDNTESFAENECPDCGMPVCGACMTTVARGGDDIAVCDYCAEDYETQETA